MTQFFPKSEFCNGFTLHRRLHSHRPSSTSETRTRGWVSVGMRASASSAPVCVARDGRWERTAVSVSVSASVRVRARLGERGLVRGVSLRRASGNDDDDDDGGGGGDDGNSVSLSSSSSSFVVVPRAFERRPVCEEKRACERCEGYGVVACARCEGRGRTNVPSGGEIMPKGKWPEWCEDCRGSGRCACVDCFGNGAYREPIGFRL